MNVGAWAEPEEQASKIFFLISVHIRYCALQKCVKGGEERWESSSRSGPAVLLPLGCGPALCPGSWGPCPGWGTWLLLSSLQVQPVPG